MSSRARRSAGLIRLSSDNVTPLTHQLAETIRRLIVDGIWIKGDRLPGSRTIANDAHISRNTVNAALDILLAEGMLESRGRSGVFVIWNHPARSPRVTMEKARDTTASSPFALDAMPRDAFPTDAWKRLQTRHLNRISSEPASEAGAQELRETLTTYANVALGIPCGVEQIIVVSGLRDALSLVRVQFAERDPEIWCEEPAPLTKRFAIRASGMTAVPIPVDNEGLNVAAALRIAPEAKAALVRPAYQFPTGAMLSPARAKDLLDWSKQSGALVIEDARDGEFVMPKRPSRPLALQSPKKVVHFNSFSRTMFKALGVGYIIVPEPLVESFHGACRQVEMHVPLATQRALADFIGSGQFAKHLKKLREIVDERRGVLLDALGEHLSGHLKIDRQQTGLYVCARLEGRESDTVIAERAGAAGVKVEPLSALFAGDAREQGLLLGFAGFDALTLLQATRTLASVFSGQALLAID